MNGVGHSYEDFTSIVVFKKALVVSELHTESPLSLSLSLVSTSIILR
jgi:hypothetical protein